MQTAERHLARRLLAKGPKAEVGGYPSVKLHATPLLCNHCDDPACATVCPTGATQKQANGIVAIDPDKCIGCRYCMVACPYNVRFFADSTREYFPGQGLTPYEKAMYAKHQVGVVEKCNFCENRLARGVGTGVRGHLSVQGHDVSVTSDDPNSDVSKLVAARSPQPLKPEAGTSPRVFYIR